MHILGESPYTKSRGFYIGVKARVRDPDVPDRLVSGFSGRSPAGAPGFAAPYRMECALPTTRDPLAHS
jgi:hypothetical protein